MNSALMIAISLLAIVSQACLLIKYETVLVGYFWSEERLKLANMEREQILNTSKHGILIFSKKEKHLLMQNDKIGRYLPTMTQ